MKKYIELIKGELMLPSLSLMKNAQWSHPMRMIKGIIRHFHQDSLYRNSIYLMLSTFIMAFFGFFFWITISRLYTAEQIGLASTLISIINLISSFSMLGLNNALIKYLPKSNNKLALINTSFTLVVFLTILASLIFIIGIEQFSPNLGFIKYNFLYIAGFILIMIISSFNTLSDSIFIAFRESKFILFYNLFMNIPKIALPFILFPIGVLGIFFSYFSGIFTAVIFTFMLLLIKYNFLFIPLINKGIAKEMMIYSFKNYLANFINSLPLLLLPIIVTNRLGPKFSAYYYISLMITNVIYIIPNAITKSFFAEGIHNESELINLTKKTIKITILALLPIIIGILFFGKYILLAFGKQFSNEALYLLQLFCLSAIFLPINSTISTILNIKGRLNVLIFICSVNAGIIIIAISLVNNLSLSLIGYIWLISQLIIAILSIIIVYMFI